MWWNNSTPLESLEPVGFDPSEVQIEPNISPTFFGANSTDFDDSFLIEFQIQFFIQNRENFQISQIRGLGGLNRRHIRWIDRADYRIF